MEERRGGLNWNKVEEINGLQESNLIRISVAWYKNTCVIIDGYD